MVYNGDYDSLSRPLVLLFPHDFLANEDKKYTAIFRAKFLRVVSV